MNNAKDSSTQGADTTYCGLVAGQHVVCIDTSVIEKAARRVVNHGGSANLPKLNVVYTIRGIYISTVTGRPTLRLVELINVALPSRQGPHEPGFPARCFRPLQKLTPEQFMQTDAPIEGREAMA